MSIVVIGLGSMGKRRIRLLKKMNEQMEIVGVDGNPKRCKDASVSFDITTYISISEAKNNKKIENAFVCTSPLSHNDIIRECLLNDWNVFTELNLVDDGYEENMKLAEERQCTLFLSSTFLYREEISYIRKSVENKGGLNYVYHVGQYLPDWHPWENYKDFFVGNKRTNGCRELMAIELPWLVEAFGDIEDVQVLSDKMSSLALEYNDNYFIQLKHTNGNKGILIIDVVCPKSVRNLEVYGEQLYLSWNGTPYSLNEFDSVTKETKNIVLYNNVEHQEGYSAFIIENAYQNEIKEFFEVVNKNKEPLYGFEKDKKILAIIDKIEGIK